MIVRKNISILFAALLMVSLVYADESIVVTPQGLPSLVRQGNPSLAAAQLTINEAAGRLLGAGRLMNPELEVGGRHNQKFREGGVEVGFSQRFPLTDRLDREREVSAAELEAARAEIRDGERLLIAEARESLVKLLVLHQQREVFEQQRKVSNDLAEFIESAAERGEGSVLDAGQSRLEAERLVVNLRQLATVEVAEIGALKRLIGVDVSQRIIVGGSLPKPSLPKSGADVVERPDLVAAGFNVNKAQSSVALERAKRFEDLKVGLVAGWERTEDAPEGFENEGIIGVRLSMPLPLWNKNEGGIAEAQARLTRREKEVVALNQTISSEVETARSEMAEWMKLANSIDDELLPLAKKQSDFAERAYRDGQGDLQAVFRVREQQLELAATRLEALRNYHLARVRYQTALGNP